jgi:hypothetical protein
LNVLEIYPREDHILFEGGRGANDGHVVGKGGGAGDRFTEPKTEAHLYTRWDALLRRKQVEGAKSLRGSSCTWRRSGS